MSSSPAAGHSAGEAIVDWYATAARDLPWRQPGTDAWAVLVSEVMLQQTPVARVEPVWREWMARWPTPADLAGVSPADVIRAWGKLGYPRRALRLREAAVAVVERHGGVVPDDVVALEALPGIGTYTARAVACFGYGQPQPVVDTNVRRVVARLLHGRAEAATARASDLADVLGHPSAVPFADRDRRLAQPQGPPRIAELAPRADHLGRRLGGEGRGRRPARHPLPPDRLHPCHRGLLQHHLADQHRPR